MTIFDILNSILHKSKLELNCDDESQFNSFMINRWISFYSPEMANFVNNTTNAYSHLLDSKQEQFKYYYNIIPKLKFKKINYIKKNKNENEDKDKVITPEFMSLKEYKLNVELQASLRK